MRAARTCSVTGCDRPYRCSGFCKLHYDRSLRLGTPHLRYVPERCTMDGCEKPHRARGWCSMHWLRWRTHGDPNTVLPNPAEVAGPMNPSWGGDNIGYTAVHQRLRRIRGNPGQHRCARCTEPAKQWAYDHTDPNEKTSNNGPYSTDLARYLPACLSCHWQMDHVEAKAARNDR